MQISALSLTLLVAACQSAMPPPRPSPTSFSLAELARNPCNALNAQDRTSLRITGDGTPQDDPDLQAKSCQWQSSDGKVRFVSYPSDDASQNAAQQPTATQTQIGNRKAVVAASALGPTVGCYLGVTIGKNSSIFVQADPPPGHGVDMCDVAISYATAILRHLH